MTYFFYILIFFLSLPAFAGQSPLARDLQKTYEATQDWTATFTQSTFVDLLGKDIQKTGQITISKPGKWRLEYTEEPPKSYISDGQKLWVYTEGDSQVSVYPKISELMATEALTFLEGVGKLEADFNIQTSTKNKIDFTDKNLKKLVLTPKNPDSGLTSIVLGIGPKNLIAEMFLFNVSGNQTHYVFQNIQLNQHPSQELFVFKKVGVKEVRN